MIILCADDYGLSPGVSRGIVELCKANRLSATSVMVTTEHWPNAAVELQKIHATTAVGLHFNLTLGKPLVTQQAAPHLSRTGSFLPINKLIIAALTRRLDPEIIRKECSAQIAAFQQSTGYLPDFIDGHQHVHALPVIRDGLIAAIRNYAWPHRPLIRHPGNGSRGWRAAIGTPAKQAVVSWLTRGFADTLHASDLPYNTSFAGYSTFSKDNDYLNELEAALASGNHPSAGPTPNADCHLTMCHPGYVDDQLRDSGDPIISRREQEMDAIMNADHLPRRIWHPARDRNSAINWRQAMTT